MKDPTLPAAPFRKIVSVEQAGCDRVTFDCGHTCVKAHRPKWGARSRCHQCRDWKKA